MNISSLNYSAENREYILLSYASPPVRKQRPHSETTSEPYKPTFLATHLMVVLQPSRYSVFHGGDTPIQLSLP